MGELSEMINIGDSLKTQLIKVGITDSEELRKTGSKEAWLRIKQIDSNTGINKLFALEGAIQNKKKVKS